MNVFFIEETPEAKCKKDAQGHGCSYDADRLGLPTIGAQLGIDRVKHPRTVCIRCKIFISSVGNFYTVESLFPADI